MENKVHLAQVNIARLKAPLESPLLAGFVARLDEINAIADGSPGFVWRLQSAQGSATYLRPYDDDRILFNMSVWESVVRGVRRRVCRSLVGASRPSTLGGRGQETACAPFRGGSDALRLLVQAGVRSGYGSHRGDGSV